MNGNNNGIIQKVFSKYFNEESPNLCDIQQELIEEIKYRLDQTEKSLNKEITFHDTKLNEGYKDFRNGMITAFREIIGDNND